MSDSQPQHSRPAVTVVLPFAGTRDEAERTLYALGTIELAEGDLIVVVDNQPGGVVPAPTSTRISVLADSTERSSYFARNRGAEQTQTEWLLFLDADCRPVANIIDQYFATRLPADCGVVAGGVVPAEGQPGLAAAYARTRGHVGEVIHVEGIDGAPPAGVTANLLVRRAAFDAVGGFHEGVVSGADIEFCWRTQEQGWTLAHRPQALVQHVYPESVGQALRKARRYGAGRRWVNRRYPGRMPRPRLLREMTRALVGLFVWTVVLRPRRGAYKLLDGLWALQQTRGFVLGDNRSATQSGPDQGVVLIAERFPELGIESPPVATAEAAARPSRPDRALARATRPRYAEDDLPLERLTAVARLFTRRPGASLRSRRAGRRAGTAGLRELAPAALRLRHGDGEVVVASDGGERAATLLGLSGRRAAQSIGRR